MRKYFLFFILCLFNLSSLQASPYQRPTKAAQKILHYWFGNLTQTQYFPTDKTELWFGNNCAIDKEICQKFKLFMIAATRGKLDGWKETPRGRLALIILLDQFPRHIYRGHANAFKFDKIAQQIALEGIKQRDDQHLLPVERIFFYSPLMHAENLSCQKISKHHFWQLVNASPTSVKNHYQSLSHIANNHFDIIRQFGRFPQRNQRLGRPSTPGEIEFLRKAKPLLSSLGR